MPSTPDGLTPTELHDYAEDERIHRNAEALAFTDLTALTAWFANISDAPRLTDWVLTELGVPEPDYHPSGHPIPGSITRKILHHAQVEGLVRQQQRRRSLVLVEG